MGWARRTFFVQLDFLTKQFSARARRVDEALS